MEDRKRLADRIEVQDVTGEGVVRSARGGKEGARRRLESGVGQTLGKYGVQKEGREQPGSYADSGERVTWGVLVVGGGMKL